VVLERAWLNTLCNWKVLLCLYAQPRAGVFYLYRVLSLRLDYTKSKRSLELFNYFWGFASRPCLTPMTCNSFHCMRALLEYEFRIATILRSSAHYRSTGHPPAGRRADLVYIKPKNLLDNVCRLEASWARRSARLKSSDESTLLGSRVNLMQRGRVKTGAGGPGNGKRTGGRRIEPSSKAKPLNI
jgi:hypothetical protein